MNWPLIRGVTLLSPYDGLDLQDSELKKKLVLKLDVLKTTCSLIMICQIVWINVNAY